jgi:hypothetical protein
LALALCCLPLLFFHMPAHLVRVAAPLLSVATMLLRFPPRRLCSASLLLLPPLFMLGAAPVLRSAALFHRVTVPLIGASPPFLLGLALALPSLAVSLSRLTLALHAFAVTLRTLPLLFCPILTALRMSRGGSTDDIKKQRQDASCCSREITHGFTSSSHMANDASNARDRGKFAATGWRPRGKRRGGRRRH